MLPGIFRDLLWTLLFSKLFQNYRRMLYLDCDIIVTGDVGELFDVDLEGKSAAGVEDVGFRWLAYTKRAIFLDNKPYNVLNYCTDVLGIKDPGGYVNAGVLLFDLEKCRQKVSFRDVVETLHSRNFFYNDQDVLNILHSIYKMPVLKINFSILFNTPFGMIRNAFSRSRIS